MSSQYIAHLPLKEDTYDLYMARYQEMKRNNKKATHDDLMRKLLGMLSFKN